jgi:hypothetical protein
MLARQHDRSATLNIWVTLCPNYRSLDVGGLGANASICLSAVSCCVVLTPIKSHRLKKRLIEWRAIATGQEWLGEATRPGSRLLSLHHSAIGHTRASVQFPSEKSGPAAISISSSETVAVRKSNSDSDDVGRSQSRSILFGMSHPPMCHRSLRLALKNS